MKAAQPKPIRLLLVDDHEVVRVGLCTLLEACPDLTVVGHAGTVAGALAEITRLQPDVVLLDIRLPDGSGLEVCKRVQDLPGAIRVLIFTSFGDDDSIFEAIRAGADGFLLKQVDSETLVEAIRKVASGQAVLDAAVTARVLGRLKRGSPVENNDKLGMLSAQERRVLALVAEGLTNKQIALQMGLSDKTVKNYLSNVLEKLALSRRSQAAAFFVQNRPSK